MAKGKYKKVKVDSPKSNGKKQGKNRKTKKLDLDLLGNESKQTEKNKTAKVRPREKINSGVENEKEIRPNVERNRINTSINFIEDNEIDMNMAVSDNEDEFQVENLNENHDVREGDEAVSDASEELDYEDNIEDGEISFNIGTNNNATVENCGLSIGTIQGTSGFTQKQLMDKEKGVYSMQRWMRSDKGKVSKINVQIM